jgi:hypothetical protein
VGSIGNIVTREAELSLSEMDAQLRFQLLGQDHPLGPTVLPIAEERN